MSSYASSSSSATMISTSTGATKGEADLVVVSTEAIKADVVATEVATWLMPSPEEPMAQISHEGWTAERASERRASFFISGTRDRAGTDTVADAVAETETVSGADMATDTKVGAAAPAEVSRNDGGTDVGT